MAEIGLIDAGCDDQTVVRDLAGGQAENVDVHDAPVEIKTGDLGQLYLYVLVSSDHMPQRRGDLARRDHAGRDLVQERLKQVVVAPINQRDVDLLAGQGTRGGQASEASAHYHHPVATVGLAGLVHPDLLL